MNKTDLTYVNPAQREAAGRARTALGTEYELQLRNPLTKLTWLQVNQTDLTFIKPAQRKAAVKTLRVRGTEYELQLRSVINTIDLIAGEPD